MSNVKGYETRLARVTRGDTWAMRCDVKLNGQPAPLDGNYSAWMTFKEHPEQTDAQAVLQLRSTLAGGSDAEAAFIANPANGITHRIKFTATAAQTGAFPNRHRTLFWDVQLKLPSGGIKTLDKGTLTMSAEMTQATA